MDFNDALGEVLCYSHDNYHTLIRQLEKHPDKWDAGVSELRAQAADAAMEHAGDLPSDDPQRSETEAVGRLLASDKPIYFWRGLPHLSKGNDKAFAERYAMSVLHNTPVSSEDDRSLYEAGLRKSDIDHSTYEELLNDGKHFYHSYHHLLPTQPAALGLASMLLWDARTPQPTSHFTDFPERYEHAAELHKAAMALGNYNITVEPDGPDAPDDTGPYHTNIYGRGGDHRWGQPAGLPEDHQ